jgi:glutamine synthetase
MPSTPREDLILVGTCDIAGQLRGKGFPARDLESRRRFGVGWTPTNIMINCLGRIPATPFGPHGDLFLVPVPEGEVLLEREGAPPERWFLGDILHLDETPWECCPRAFLKRALAALESESGLRLVASFEHEFHLAGAPHRSGDSYALSSMRAIAPFTRDLLAALRANGLAPDTFLPEYGPRQYEVTVCPAPALEAADRAVKLREITRALAERHGLTASFSPVVTRGIVGNGVHVHFSLQTLDGAPATWDPEGPANLSREAAAFAAGILRHAAALTAVTAPSVISYERLKPHSWSAYWTSLGLRDREALIRICPLPAASDIDPRPRFNLEFRAADACASPYLQLGTLVFAGLEGLRAGLPAPPVIETDPETLPEAERARLGIGVLPRSLAEALDALEADTTAMGWLGPVLAEAYLMHKHGEVAMMAEHGVAMLRLYADAY